MSTEIAENFAEVAKVILKKKEVRSNNDLPIGPLGLASLSGTSSPHLLLSAKEEDHESSCEGFRREVLSSRPLLDTERISYMRLSLLDFDAKDFDGKRYTRLAANMDCSFNNNHKFNRFKWRLTNKRSEFYANLPSDWRQDPAYSAAWDSFNSTDSAWIGKATYRLNRREQANKMKLVPLTAMVMWAVEDEMHYRIWFESALVTGQFNLPPSSKYFVASSEPVRNFKPSGFQRLEL